MNKTEIDGGAFVFKMENDQPIYLLLKSATSDFWGYPKGHVEGDETLAEAAQREVREETGLEVDIDLNFETKVEYDMNNGNHKVVTFFVAEVPADAQVHKQDEEISDYKWCTYQQALDLVTYDNLKAPLTAANDYIRSHYE